MFAEFGFDRRVNQPGWDKILSLGSWLVNKYSPISRTVQGRNSNPKTKVPTTNPRLYE
jgi:hypothetical protein